MIRRDLMLAGMATFALGWPTRARALDPGTFSGNPEVRFREGRIVELLRELRYRDPRRTVWRVPRGFMSDGASIPRFLWSLAGGPLDGPYRDAALVHDCYCESMERTWAATHRVFYDAMRSRSLSQSDATKKYWAVFYFGPRWNDDYRWNGALELNKRPRHNREPASAPPPPSSEQIIAATQADAELYAFQSREFARVAAIIDKEGLGPNDVLALKPTQ